MKNKKTKAIQNNLTAKHAHRYNRATVYRDRKKDSKRGKQKHKQQEIDE
jgi:hypothetical protein